MVCGSGSEVQGSGSRDQGSGCRVQGAQDSGFRVQGAGFRVQGSWFRIWGSGFRLQGSGFRVQGSWFMVHGSGFGVQDEGFTRTPCRSLQPARCGGVPRMRPIMQIGPRSRGRRSQTVGADCLTVCHPRDHRSRSARRTPHAADNASGAAAVEV